MGINFNANQIRTQNNHYSDVFLTRYLLVPQSVLMAPITIAATLSSSCRWPILNDPKRAKVYSYSEWDVH